MTRKEAIADLQNALDTGSLKVEHEETLEMAINSLKVDEMYQLEYERADSKGEWILVVDSYYEDGTIKENHWECSKCGSGKSGWGEYKFCPNCGADMRGKAE